MEVIIQNDLSLKSENKISQILITQVYIENYLGFLIVRKRGKILHQSYVMIMMIWEYFKHRQNYNCLE